MAFYRVRLDVPRELVLFVSGLLAGHRREIGTRKGTRKLGCYRQALFGWRGSGTRATSRGWARGSGCRSRRPTGTWMR